MILQACKRPSKVSHLLRYRVNAPHIAGLMFWKKRYQSTDDFSNDLFDSLSKEHERERRLRSMPSSVDFESMIIKMLPEVNRKSQMAIDALRGYFLKNKINNFIPCEKVRITHIETNDQSANQTIDRNLTYSIEEAIAIAEQGGNDLVMMAEKDGVAFCKIKNEKKRALQQIENLLTQTDVSRNANTHELPRAKAMKTEEFIFRDVIDTQAIEWKSKYAMQALKKNRQVKLICEKFSSPRIVVEKLQQFLEKIRDFSQTENIAYNAMQLSASDRTFVVTLTPTQISKGIRNPGRAEWDKVMQRFQNAFDRCGRDNVGTWQTRHKKKATRTGPSLFRTDKFGNRIDSATDNAYKNITAEDMAKKHKLGMEKLAALKTTIPTTR